jgi:hypothetical protein
MPGPCGQGSEKFKGDCGGGGPHQRLSRRTELVGVLLVSGLHDCCRTTFLFKKPLSVLLTFGIEILHRLVLLFLGNDGRFK